MCRLRLPRRAPRNVAHESTVTRPQSAPSANAISNFPEADFFGTWDPLDDHSTLADLSVAIHSGDHLDYFRIADYPPGACPDET